MNIIKKSNNFLLIGLAGVAAFFVSCGGEEHHDHDGHDHGDHDHSHDHESHDHGDHDSSHTKKEAGPNGGRVITTVEPHIEFFVTPEKNVQISILDEANKAIEPTTQIIQVIGGDRTNPTILTFTKSGNKLISDKALPDVANMPIILQIQQTAESEVIREKFNLNLANCPTCSVKEYACACEHGDDDPKH